MKKSKNLPIGYWLKRADELLTKGIDKIQSSNGLSRTNWQILNAIEKMGITSQDKIVETLHPFADPATIVNSIKNLIKKELVTESTNDNYKLTQAGSDLYGRALRKQKEFRGRAGKGITKEEYAVTIEVLKKLVDNLENYNAGQPAETGSKHNIEN